MVADAAVFASPPVRCGRYADVGSLGPDRSIRDDAARTKVGVSALGSLLCVWLLGTELPEFQFERNVP